MAANDEEAQIIQQVMEMSRREQDEFERVMALSLADTERGGVGQVRSWQPQLLARPTPSPASSQLPVP